MNAGVATLGEHEVRPYDRVSDDILPVEGIAGLCAVQGDFVELRPELAGHEESLPFLVPRDSVENIDLKAGLIFWCQQTGEVDTRSDIASRWVNPYDLVGLPDVGVDLAVDPLQLVEVVDWLPILADLNAVDFAEGVRLADLDGVCSIAHVEPLAVVGDAPSFGGVGKPLDLLERLRVVDDRRLRLPGDLKDATIVQRDAFSEQLR